MFSCVACPSNTYQVASGASTCVLCPDNPNGSTTCPYFFNAGIVQEGDCFLLMGLTLTPVWITIVGSIVTSLATAVILPGLKSCAVRLCGNCTCASLHKRGNGITEPVGCASLALGSARVLADTDVWLAGFNAYVAFSNIAGMSALPYAYNSYTPFARYQVFYLRLCNTGALTLWASLSIGLWKKAYDGGISPVQGPPPAVFPEEECSQNDVDEKTPNPVLVSGREAPPSRNVSSMSASSTNKHLFPPQSVGALSASKKVLQTRAFNVALAALEPSSSIVDFSANPIAAAAGGRAASHDLAARSALGNGCCCCCASSIGGAAKKNAAARTAQGRRSFVAGSGGCLDSKLVAWIMATIPAAIFIPIILTHAIPMAAFMIYISLIIALFLYCVRNLQRCLMFYCARACESERGRQCIDRIFWAIAPTLLNLSTITLIYLGVIVYTTAPPWSRLKYLSVSSSWYKLTNTNCYLQMLRGETQGINAALVRINTISQFI